MSDYDICVIGAGLIGSAAAKYCGLFGTGARIILIGPDEPTEKAISFTCAFFKF